MRKLKEIVTYLLVITLGAVPFCSPSLAIAAPARADCQEIDFPGSSFQGAFGAFEEIAPEYIRDAFFTDPPQGAQDPSENAANIDEIMGGAMVVVITNQSQPAKVLASLDGTDLLIRKLVTYGSDGGTAVEAKNVRLSEGGRLDLDAGTVNPPPANADLRWRKDGKGWKLEPVNGVRFKILIPVPVIVHYMNSKDRSNSEKRVQDDFTPKTFLELFRPIGSQRMINWIWAKAGILFFLYHLEDCKYSLVEFGSSQETEVSEGVPSPEEDCQCLFRRINGVYNFLEVHGLNLYVWSSMKVLGYAARHRKDGPSPGPGAVWIKSTCMGEEADCDHKLAHEIGHFLLGCHICAASPTERRQCGFCPDIPDCSAEHRDRLLLPAGAGTGTVLITDEILKARERALERVRGRS